MSANSPPASQQLNAAVQSYSKRSLPTHQLLWPKSAHPIPNMARDQRRNPLAPAGNGRTRLEHNQMTRWISNPRQRYRQRYRGKELISCSPTAERLQEALLQVLQFQSNRVDFRRTSSGCASRNLQRYALPLLLTLPHRPCPAHVRSRT